MREKNARKPRKIQEFILVSFDFSLSQKIFLCYYIHQPKQKGGEILTSKNQILKGTTALTIAALIMKILSAFYRIPYQNITGDVGFYVYQQVYPFYAVVIAMSTYGYPVVISKLIAEREDDSAIFKILRTSFLFVGLLSIILSASLYFGANNLANIMGDIHVAPLLRTISIAFLFLPYLTVIRGYYQGLQNMMPTAISQVVEQSVRVMLILFLAQFLVGAGHSMYEVGMGAIVASTVGSFVALIFLMGRMGKDISIRKFWVKSSISTKKIIRTLFISGFFICVTSMMLVLIPFVDSFSLLSLLVGNGVELESAKALKGVYDRGQPLIQLGTVVATSFSLALVPLLSEAKKHGEDIGGKISVVLRVALFVGTGATLGLLCLMNPINQMLFTTTSGTIELMILSVSIIGSSLAMTLAAILQGIGKESKPVIALCVGVCIKWLLNSLLVPHYSLKGAAVATVFAYFVISVLQWWEIRKLSSERSISFRSLILASVVMISILFIYMEITMLLSNGSRLFAALQALGGVTVGALVYIFTAMRTNLFSQSEWGILPMGKKIMRVMGNR